MINVLVAAESAMARTGLEALIAAHDSLRVIQTDASLPLWRRVEDGRAEVLVVAVDRQAVSRTLRELARLPRPPATIFLTDDLRAVRTSEARRAGVLAVLPRGATASELGAAIEAVAAGLIVLHPEGVDALLSPSSLPSAAGAGATRIPFELAVTHYDDPPPDGWQDLDEVIGPEGARFANDLRAWIEVQDGRIAGTWPTEDWMTGLRHLDVIRPTRDS